jgi:hypothetical protein
MRKTFIASGHPAFPSSLCPDHESPKVFEAKYLIRLMQANAKRLDKFGA